MSLYPPPRAEAQARSSWKQLGLLRTASRAPRGHPRSRTPLLPRQVSAGLASGATCWPRCRQAGSASQRVAPGPHTVQVTLTVAKTVFPQNSLVTESPEDGDVTVFPHVLTQPLSTPPSVLPETQLLASWTHGTQTRSVRRGAGAHEEGRPAAHAVGAGPRGRAAAVEPVCVRARVCACACVCVRVCTYVHRHPSGRISVLTEANSMKH